MRNFLCLTAFFTLLLSHSLAAQRQALVPKGNTQILNMPLEAFHMLELLWVDGMIEVVFGAKANQLEITSTENILALLQVENGNNRLKIHVKGNKNNRLWIEDGSTRIKILSTEQPRQIIYKCNADASIRGIQTDYLALEKDENGNLALQGSAQYFIIRQRDNGNIEAQQLAVQNADIIISGNGAARVNAQSFSNRKSSGNGAIMNANAPAQD